MISRYHVTLPISTFRVVHLPFCQACGGDFSFSNDACWTYSSFCMNFLGLNVLNNRSLSGWMRQSGVEDKEYQELSHPQYQ